MIVVIIAGGSGTRLWPLSTPDYPKHLLTINNEKRSLMQNTYDRAKRLTDKIYVVSEASHIAHVKEQLSDLPDEAFICEPARRGTANCIVAALTYLAERHDADEPIAVISADHYIRDLVGFAHSFRLADAMSREHGRIVLVGVEPDYPATGFGYIQKGEILNDEKLIYNVHSFKEKPDVHTAQKYVDSGNYLWNCGYFVGSLNTFLRKFDEYAPQLRATFDSLTASKGDAYENAYLATESETIDYALIEKVNDLLVVPAAFDWMDLGSFADLAKAVGTDDDAGNGLFGDGIELDDVNNSYVHNEEAKPIAVIGLDNVVVVNTPKGILIARKDRSQRVGDISKRINAKANA